MVEEGAVAEVLVRSNLNTAKEKVRKPGIYSFKLDKLIKEKHDELCINFFGAYWLVGSCYL